MNAIVRNRQLRGPQMAMMRLVVVCAILAQGMDAAFHQSMSLETLSLPLNPEPAYFHF